MRAGKNPLNIFLCALLTLGLYAAPAFAAADDVDANLITKAGSVRDMTYGEEDAPVTIVEYTSLTCPHCATFATQTFPQIKARYIDTGKLRFILREFPFDPRATAAFVLARCAPEDRYFQMIETFFSRQGEWSTVPNGKDALLRIAKEAGFTDETFHTCLTNQPALDAIKESVERGSLEFGVTAAPTLFIDGKRVTGAPSYKQLSKMIDDALRLPPS